MPIDLTTIPALLNYDTAIDWPARLEREGPFLLRALEAAPSRRVLDLGSGTGEHADWLAAQGFAVVGIEGVKERWDVARSRATPNVEHLLGDLGAVEAMVRGHFGAALCLGNTLPALLGAEAVSRMLIGLRRRLLPSGVFVARQLDFDRIRHADIRELPERRLSTGDGDLLFRRTLAPRADGVVGVSDTVLLRLSGDETQGTVVHQRNLFQQGWSKEELLTLLDVARFGRVDLTDSNAAESSAAAEAPELTLIAI